MDTISLLFLLICLLFTAFVYSTWNDNYWLKRGIPFVERHKFFGNIKDIVTMKKTIGQVYLEIYKQLGDKPLGGFFKFRQPILMIKHPDLIKEVLVTKFDCFNANDINVRRDTNPILKMNPLLSSGATRIIGAYFGMSDMKFPTPKLIYIITSAWPQGKKGKYYLPHDFMV